MTRNLPHCMSLPMALSRHEGRAAEPRREYLCFLPNPDPAEAGSLRWLACRLRVSVQNLIGSQNVSVTLLR